MIRIGLIGCGEVANFGHLPALVQNSKFDVAALLDPNPTRLARTSAKFGNIPPYQNSEDFYAAALDAVVIASPAPAHHANVMEAARKGVHVLCEKPISFHEGEAYEMRDAMSAAKKIFCIGYCYRFSPVTHQIKQWVEDGAVGQVRSIRMIYNWNLHGRYEPGVDGKWAESPRWRGRMLEGGPMVDCGVHAIDLIRHWLAADPIQVKGYGAWVADYDAPDHAFLHMDFPGGTHAFVEMSYSYGHTVREPLNEFKYELIGDGGVIRYNRDGYVLEYRDGQRVVQGQGASEKNFAGMYDVFAEAILTGNSDLLPSAEDGILATRIAWEATRQAIEKRATIVPGV